MEYENVTQKVVVPVESALQNTKHILRYFISF